MMEKAVADALIEKAHRQENMEDQIRLIHAAVTACYVGKAHVRMGRYSHDVGFLLNKIEELRAEIVTLRMDLLGKV